MIIMIKKSDDMVPVAVSPEFLDVFILTFLVYFVETTKLVYTKTMSGTLDVNPDVLNECFMKEKKLPRFISLEEIL